MNTEMLYQSYPTPINIWLYSLCVLRSQDSELCADFGQQRDRGHHYGEGVKPDPGRLHFSDHLQVLVGLLHVVIDVDRDHTLVFPWFFCRKRKKICSRAEKCGLLFSNEFSIWCKFGNLLWSSKSWYFLKD